MTAPVLAVGDGVCRGILEGLAGRVPRHPRAAVLVPRQLQASWPPCRSRRTQVRKPRSPRSTTPRTRDHALQAVKAFEVDDGAKWPKAVAKITEHVDVLLAFYDYPAEHWVHLRTTNPIESTFATVRLRQRITKGPGSRAAGVAMAFKLIESAQARWRAVNAPHLVALVRAGARFEKGTLVERPDESGGDQQVA